MTRKEKVYRALKALSDDLLLEDIDVDSKVGFDAGEIARITDIDRSNVSRELNDLVREEKVFKINGRPVLFVSKESLEENANIIYGGDHTFATMADFLKILSSETSESFTMLEDPFDEIVGADGSLELAIKQAKAAMLYPPRGLHTLITGPTGVGKTTFAEMMYKYAVHIGAIPENIEFIIFNCSEYAENPQLIFSQLFGHVKGAFTGANEEKAGLIEKADGGILLLDEIHRLSPEGQEMLFLLLDKNIYRKLGETEGYREANVLLIGATTEDVGSALLGTFLRRIPMAIDLPPLDKRPLSERLEFIEDFFVEEVNNVKVPVKVHKDVLKAFLLYDCKGNIGQLKGDIQLLCARGFLDYKTYNKAEIKIDTTLLPEHIHGGLLSHNRKREEILSLLEYEKEYYVFMESKKSKFVTVDKYNISNLYSEITEKYNNYRARGYSKDKITDIINGDIEGYLKKLLEKSNVDKAFPKKEELFKVISSRVYSAVETALKFAGQKLDREFNNRTIIGLAMHISALMERLAMGKIIYNEEINTIALNNPEEFMTAKIIREILQQELEISIPKEEIGFLTMFLSAVDSGESYKKIGVIVLAHGESTASSIADVANNLLGTQHCNAIDMPLDAKVEDILEETIRRIEEIDEGKGVLLLVDMGSLTAFPDIIYKKTKIITKSVENVSTPVVIEALRKSLLPEMTLETLVEEIKTANPYIGRLIGGGVKNKANIEQEKLILTTCISGKGAAVKIAELLQNTLPFIEERNIKVKAIDIEDRSDLSHILNNMDHEHILSIVGTVDLKIPGVPFIPIDELIIGEGTSLLESYIGRFSNVQIQERSLDNRLVEDNLFINLLEDMLTFLNPGKAYDLVNKSFMTLSNLISIDDYSRAHVRYIVHNCCMIERLIQGEILPYNNVSILIESRIDLYNKIKLSLRNIEDSLGVEVPDTEIAYIIELIDTQ